MPDKPFGSGNFGEWIEDSFGLPAYRYTCNQVIEPRAVTPTDPSWRSPTDHSHQVGNNRLVAVASNYGWVQVRQDEGGPKFLNDYDPVHGHFAGGFGYLIYGENALCTFYSGQEDAFERIFGTGYLRKITSRAGYTADQIIFAPYGDDPLLISQVTINNHNETAANLHWIEYWGCQMYQFSHRAQVLSVISRGKKFVQDLRRQFSTRFVQSFTQLEGRHGLLNMKSFLGYTREDRTNWAIAQTLLATVARKSTGGALKPPVKEAYLEDLSPLPTFLVSLDAPVEGFAVDEAAFFGSGGIEHPDGLERALAENLPDGVSGQALLLERKVHLKPGESKTLYFAYGYLPDGFSIQSLVSKYGTNLTNRFAESCAAWKENRIHLEIPGESWIDRELAWHSYYLRSSMTYDSFFKEHILSQGHVYQYLIGFQGAARDPLQHALPFIYTAPDLVKEIIRYTMKEVLPDGEIPYGVTGHGMRMAVPFRPSDQELWLLWITSEYVLATRNLEFLDEQLPTFPLYGPKAGRASVREILDRCFTHLATVTGTGKHGLLRLSNGDWNDGAVVGFVPQKQHEEVRKNGESVLNAALATFVLDLYAQMLEFSGDQTKAAAAVTLGNDQRKAVRDQWTGKWFRRGWLSENLGWIGEEELWLEPQPWAIIGGAADLEQQKELVANLDKLVRKPSPIGAMLLDRTLPQSELPPGTLTNAGVWPSINGTLVWALAMVDGTLAWDEWKKNTLAYHAEAYPDIWYGIWSGPDTYNSILSKYAGQTYFDEKAMQGGTPDSPLNAGANWTDFPVMNLHPHAWPLYDTTRLLGLKFTPQGLELSPTLPLDAYRFASPLLGFEKTQSEYNGWYAPQKPGRWQINLLLPEIERGLFTTLLVNEEEIRLQYRKDGAIQWKDESSSGQPLRWSLK